MKYLFIVIISMQSCIFRVPSLKITDKFIAISKPGSSWALVEINKVELDSIFGYPKEDGFVRSFTIVEKKAGKKIPPNSKVKIFFANTNKRYEWKIYNDFYLQSYHLTDSIVIKPNSWYALGSDNCSYRLYFYWTGKEGDYFVKEKPKPGAW